MSDHYWLIHPNGGWQRIDPKHFDLDVVAEQAQRTGGRLVILSDNHIAAPPVSVPKPAPSGPPARFEPPISALGPLFRTRFERIYACLEAFDLEINTRPTTRVLGGYYKTRRLVRIYSHDRATGRRPVEELFDTFLHEMAHHLEYTEPDSFHARAPGRVPGRMHSRLFWRILGELKGRWADLQRG